MRRCSGWSASLSDEIVRAVCAPLFALACCSCVACMRDIVVDDDDVRSSGDRPCRCRCCWRLAVAPVVIRGVVVAPFAVAAAAADVPFAEPVAALAPLCWVQSKRQQSKER